jgi:hypothetical protein
MYSQPKVKNSEKFKINNQYFYAGMALDFKMGIANSFYNSRNLDFRTFPSQMSVLPASTSISTNLRDLVTAIDQDLDGVRWAVGDKGYIYEIDTNNVVSNVGQLTENGSAGLLYCQITDQLYIPGQTTVSMYGRVTRGGANEPAFRQNQFAQSASVANGCVNLYNPDDGLFDSTNRNNAQVVGSTVSITDPTQVTINSSFISSYVPPASIIENAQNFCFFAPDIEPFYSVAVWIPTIGTGNFTLTMHDALNNNLGSATITHANMVSGWNNFIFGSQVRAFVNASNIGGTATYHFHLTSTVQDASVSVLTAGDLSTCCFLLFAYRLVQTNNGWHPTAFFTGTGQPLLCIGNGEYLSTYNFFNDKNPSNNSWQRHTLTFRPGDEVCGLSVNNQYLVIATERRSNDAARNAQLGTLYFWDGSTSAPNFLITLPMGSPYGLYTFNNITYFECAGSLYAWSGGQTVIKVRKFVTENTDFLGTTDSTVVYPNGFTSRYNILYMAYPGSSTNTNLTYGIWSWGTPELTYPNSFGYSYTQSHGLISSTGSTNLKVGAAVNFVDSLYNSWQYTDGSSVTHYGLDVVDNLSAPASTFYWQSLIFDGGAVYKEKMAVRYKITFEALPTGCTLTPFYAIDRGTTVTGPTATAGDTEVFMEQNNARFHELQWGFSGTCTAATAPPVILGITEEVDSLPAEVDLLPNER